MTQRTCGACDQPIRHTLRQICFDCERATATLLNRQPELRAELFIEYRRQARKTEQLRILYGGDRPMLFEEKAARLLTRQASWLAAWATVCDRVTKAATGRRDYTVESSAAYIASRLPALRKLPESAQLVNELRQLTVDIMELIDTPQLLARFAAGPCPQPADDGGKCGGTIQALGRRSSPLLVCDVCRTQWDSTQWGTAGRLILAREQELKRQRELALALTQGAA